MTLLEAGQCRLCLVVAVDELVPDLETGIRTLYPEGCVRGEGAGALLLTGDSGLALAAPGAARARILALEQNRARGTSAARGLAPGYYDSNALELIARGYKGAQEILLPKPDGSGARLVLEAIS